MSTMLPIFFGDVPDETLPVPRSRPGESGSNSSGPELPVLTSRSYAGGAKKKRVLTEARKEQNREAQRLFRQRQRERREQQQQEVSGGMKKKRKTKLQPRTGKESPLNEGSIRSTSGSDGTSSSGHVLSTTDSSSPYVLSDDEETVDVQAIPHSLVAAALRPYMSDPLANTMEFIPTTVFGACLHNALALGADLSDLVACGPEGISPFYRPSTPADDPAALFSCAMLSLTRRPPPNLLPTLTQILIPHHPSLDLIPLPHLRDQAIMLSASMPQVFNMWELKLDIYQRGGLVMLKKRTGSNGKIKTCQPWEKSSWVAQPWFLRKWSMVVVGEREQLSKAVPSDNDDVAH